MEKGILIVNDCSKDDTQVVVEWYIAGHSGHNICLPSSNGVVQRWNLTVRSSPANGITLSGRSPQAITRQTDKSHFRNQVAVRNFAPDNYREMSALHNRVNRDEMRERLMKEEFRRVTLSFYRYVIIGDAQKKRDELWREWSALQVFGRIYIAHEGINAQLSVPEHYFQEFRHKLDMHPEFRDVPFKIAVEDDGKSFFRLTIKVRDKIVADGLPDDAFDVTNVGNHLTALEFNNAMEDPKTIVVDMRNHYESEVGHFENALLPQSESFREELPLVLDQLKGKEDQKILMYCTGGIRCEKASAFLKHHGFKDVNQLYGGIIEYARQIKDQDIPSKFIGKNFVFDERLGERITDDVIAHCHQCGKKCDHQINCGNTDCHVLFIQCDECRSVYGEFCTHECRHYAELPAETRAQLRKEGKAVKGGSSFGGAHFSKSIAAKAPKRD